MELPIQNTFRSLQLGLYNAGTANSGQVAAGAKRSFFGFDDQGRVGSLSNQSGSPAFRNLLDDGSGNLSLAGNLNVRDTGAAFFGEARRQMVNLWASRYGIGVQDNTFYSRSDGGFAWYRGGSHANAELSPGPNGAELMRLNNVQLQARGHYVRVNGSGSEDVYMGGDGIANDAEFGSFNSSVTEAVIWNAGRNETMNLTVKALNTTSDRARKKDFTAVDPEDVLSRVAGLSLESWSYRGEDGIRHLGPTAQDFRQAFGLGADDKHIASVDADGVALAAIQGLNRKLEESLCEKGARIEALEKTVTDLKELVGALISDQQRARQHLGEYPWRHSPE